MGDNVIKKTQPREASLITDIGGDSLPSNSMLSKQRNKSVRVKKGKVKPVAKVRKKSAWRRYLEAFIGDEDPSNLQEYVIYDIVIPAIKSTLSEAITGGMEMLLFGSRRGDRGNVYRDRGRSYVNYSSYSSSDNKRTRRFRTATHDFEDILFDTREEAERVLSHLSDLVIDYGMASVADFYDLCGVDSQFTDDRYGWTNLRSSHVDRVRGGYSISLPRTVEL